MADLVEDAQRTGPGPVGCLVVAGAVLDVAQTVERVGLVETISQFPPEIDRPLITRNGLLVVAEPVMDETQAVPGGGFPVGLPHLADDGQGAVGEGLLVSASQVRLLWILAWLTWSPTSANSVRASLKHG